MREGAAGPGHLAVRGLRQGRRRRAKAGIEGVQRHRRDGETERDFIASLESWRSARALLPFQTLMSPPVNLPSPPTSSFVAGVAVPIPMLPLAVAMVEAPFPVCVRSLPVSARRTMSPVVESELNLLAPSARPSSPRRLELSYKL